MTLDKSCPGSRSIRQPTPEYLKCPECGAEVEIWTDELKATCSACGGKVYRAQQASCIDWCPYAKECVGPEVYARLKPGVEEDLSPSDSPLAILEREHERAEEMLGLLRGAGLCLKMSALKPGTPVEAKGIENLTKVLDFFDQDLRIHFRREEEVLFPALEKYLGVEKSPTQLLLKEHQEAWGYYDRLRTKVTELQQNGSQQSVTLVKEVQDLSDGVGRLLEEHIKKENESLLPLAQRIIPRPELEALSQQLRQASLPVSVKGR